MEDTSVKTRNAFRVWAIWGTLFVVPFIFYPSALTSSWVSNSDVHSLLEFWAAIIGFIATGVILIHFFATGRKFFLVISLGFTLQGTEDLVHAIYSFSRIWPAEQVGIVNFVPGTYVAGRLLLISCILLALRFAKKTTLIEKRAKEAIIYNTIGFCVAALVTIIIINSPLPRFISPGHIISRPVDFAAALIYLGTLSYFVRMYRKEEYRTPFLWSIIGSLIYGFAAQVYMVHSQQLYDAQFDTSHVLKILSYIFPIGGIAVGIFSMYKKEEKLSEDLYRKTDELAGEIVERKRAEEQIQQSYENQTAINALLSISSEDIPLDDMLQRILDQITSVSWLSIESKGVILLVEDKPDVLVMKVQRGLPEPLKSLCARVPFGRCICGLAASARGVEFTDCIDDRHEIRYDNMSPHGHYCLPILYGDQVLGVLNLYVKAGCIRNEREEGFLRAAADVLASIVVRKQAEQAMKDLNDELKSAVQKLSRSNQRLKEFTYVASHDLREPLRKISSFGQLLKESLKGQLPHDDEENLDFMVDGADRMTAMIEGLLTYSRVDTQGAAFQKVDLNGIVEQLRQLELANLLEETGGTIEVPEPLPEVQADPVQIRQLLQNLIANGIKYHRDGVQPRIVVRAEQAKKNTVRIEVQDNGTGIEEKYHDDIFTMFRRLHSRRKYEGTGIGLAVCKKIVERHNGRIGVESKVDEGSVFWFTISSAKEAVVGS